MSTKRSATVTKRRGSDREKDNAVDFWAKPIEPAKTWEEQMDGKPEGGFVPYLLATRFAKGQLVVHGKFGKGVIVDADATRIEILFQEGMKKLGHAQA